MGEEFTIFAIVAATLIAVLFGGMLEYQNESNERKDSIVCVKAGGTWDKGESVCLNR